MKHSLLRKSLFVAVINLSFFFSSFSQVVSDFSTSADGWTAPSAGTFSYTTIGGNPGGYIAASDPVSAGPPIFWTFNAPAKFLGNVSGLYNSTIKFNLNQGSPRTAVQSADVILSNGATSLFYFSISPSYPSIAPSWSAYSVTVNEIGGNWKTANSSTAPAATASQIQAVLSNLTSFQIRGRFGTSTLTFGSLDNVEMNVFSITVNSQPASLTTCGGSSIQFSTTASGTANITFQWQYSADGISPFADITNTGGYTNTSTATLSVNTTGNFGAGFYRCKVNGDFAATVFTNAAQLIVNPIPTAPTVTGAGRCGNGSVTLTAAGGSNGQYKWYTAASGGTAITGEVNSPYTTPSLSSTTPYFVSLTISSCESTRTSVTATINPLPPPPSTTGASACLPSASVILNASGGTNGQYRWYTVPTGGTAIAGQTNSSFTTPTLSATTTYYVSIDNGTCESIRTSVVATLLSCTTPPTITTASLSTRIGGFAELDLVPLISTFNNTINKN